MATIQSSIQLTDGMSPVLRSMNTALNILLNTFEATQLASSKAIDTASIQVARNELARASVIMNDFENEARQAASAQQNLTNTVKRTNDAVNKTIDPINRVEKEINEANASQSRFNSNSRTAVSVIKRIEAGFDKVVSAIGMVSKQLGGMGSQMQRIASTTHKIQTGQQQLTNTVRQGNTALQQTASAIHRASINQIRLTSSFKQSVTSAMRLRQSAGSIAPAINQNTSAQQRFNNTLNSSVGGMSVLLGKLKGIAGAYFGIQSVKGIVGTADELTMTNARLNMINDGLQTTAELEDKIYQAAMRSRGGFMETADTVAKLGQRAGDIFKSNDETIAFAETLNKMFVIAGASQAEMSSATLQLTQALGSGVLRGEEFNAVFEAAPNIMRAVADSMGVPIGKLRELAADGEISAQVVKNAIFKASADVNKQFESMQYTWGQVWTTIKNFTIKATRPILQAISNITQNERFIRFANGVGNAISKVSNIIQNMYKALSPVLAWVYDAVVKIGDVIVDKWNLFEPIVWGIVSAMIALKAKLALVAIWSGICAVAQGILTGAKILATFFTWALTSATLAEAGAMWGLNGALYACPITWIIVAIIALIVVVYLVVAAINEWRDTTVSATGVIVGSVMWLGAAIWNIIAWLVNVIIGAIFALGVIIANIVIGIMNVVAGVVQAIVNSWTWCCDNIGIIFDNIGIWWTNLWADCYIFFCDFITKVISKLSSLAKHVEPFAELLGMDLTGKLENIQNNVDATKDALEAKKSDYKSLKPFEKVNWESVEYLSVGDAWDTGYNMLGYLDLGETYDKGYNWGDEKSTQLENFFSGKNFEKLSDDAIKALEDKFGVGNVDQFGNVIDPSKVSGGSDKLNDIGKALSGGLGGGSGSNPTLDKIASDTSDIKDSLDTSSDDLSFMRDLAERRAINRHYYTDMNVTQNNNNHIKNGVDADAVINKLRRGIFEALSGGAEGQHI